MDNCAGKTPGGNTHPRNSGVMDRATLLKLKSVGALLLLVVISGILWFAYGSAAMLYFAKQKAVKNQTALLSEMRRLLKMEETSGKYFWFAAELPPVMKSLKPRSAQVGLNGGGIILHFTGGFRHSGLIVADDPRTTVIQGWFSPNKVSDHLWLYTE